MATVEQRKQIPLRMPLADFVRFAALAARGGVSFNSWVQEAMLEKARRENGEKGVDPVQNRPLQRPAGVPRLPVRLPEAAALGTGRVGEVRSSEFAVERERARMLAERDGKCTADTPRGTRCKFCSQVHL